MVIATAQLVALKMAQNCGQCLEPVDGNVKFSYVPNKLSDMVSLINVKDLYDQVAESFIRIWEEEVVSRAKAERVDATM
jgi:hypothetical protein